MAIKISVSQPEHEKIRVTVHEQESPRTTQVSLDLKARRTLDGNILIFDHKDIDIVVQPATKKVVTFAKETMSDAVYGAESRLLEYLRRQGVVNYDSIQGGNNYGSLEGQIMDSKSYDSIKVTLLKISEWMETEQPYITGTTAYDDLQDDALIDPDNEHSTELGEVPHEERKGSIHQNNLFAPYLYGRYTY